LTRIKTTGEGAAELKKALLKREIIHNAKKQPAQLFRLPPTAFTPEPVRRRVAAINRSAITCGLKLIDVHLLPTPLQFLACSDAGGGKCVWDA
jgi:hypothetical protein